MTISQLPSRNLRRSLSRVAILCVREPLFHPRLRHIPVLLVWSALCARETMMLIQLETAKAEFGSVLSVWSALCVRETMMHIP